MRRPVSESSAGLSPLTESLADIVCWIVFFLQRCSPDEIDVEVAGELQGLVADGLGRLTVRDRLVFLQHALRRAESSSVPEYQAFLLDLAESLGLQ